MSILGVGCDVLSLPRFHRVFKKYPDRIKSKLLSEEELKMYNGDWNYLATRFSVKESAFKATQTHTWKTLTLSKDGRKPILKSELGHKLLVSISHDSGMIFTIVNWIA
eukprot:NODE_556_length_6108_cov_1.468464.p5 type:complete len:108 gc:universal NODE_556_length_6108_cov_1.468464:26-349(+)